MTSTKYVSAYLILSITGNEEQPSNALSPILVRELEMVTEVRIEHPLNALSPIFVTEFGIVTEERFAHLENAELPILVT